MTTEPRTDWKEDIKPDEQELFERFAGEIRDLQNKNITAGKTMQGLPLENPCRRRRGIRGAREPSSACACGRDERTARFPCDGPLFEWRIEPRT